MTTAEMPRTIRATIHQDAITRVPDFFNASLPDMLNELLQNSRRSGATSVQIERDQQLFTVRDDGRGIEDPQALLAFGLSNWDQQLTDSEHPAGMGLYSLARAGEVTIVSKTPGAPAWQVTLSKQHFTGQEEAPVLPAPLGTPQGTSITFTAPQHNQDAVNDAAKHYPLPVTLNGEPVDRKDFLQACDYIEEWRGIRIGAAKEHVRSHHQRHLNFHGVTVREESLPYVHTRQYNWYPKLDVIDCPELTLTLPARRQIVQTPFLKELHQAAKAAIYRAILDSGITVDLTRADAEEARAMGIDLPDARPILNRWTPAIAEDNHYATPTPLQVEPHHLLMAVPDLEPPDQQAVARAIELNGDSIELLEEDDHVKDYDWYQEITRIEEISISVFQGDEELDLLKYRNRETGPINDNRPDRIVITLSGTANDGNPVEFPLETDLAYRDAESSPSEPGTALVTKRSQITVDDLVDIDTSSFFFFNDDIDDGYEAQQDYFQDQARRAATTMLHSHDQAVLNSITTMVRRHISYQVPADATAVITIGPATANPPKQVSVTLTKTDAPEEPSETV